MDSVGAPGREEWPAASRVSFLPAGFCPRKSSSSGSFSWQRKWLRSELALLGTAHLAVGRGSWAWTVSSRLQLALCAGGGWGGGGWHSAVDGINEMLPSSLCFAAPGRVPRRDLGEGVEGSKCPLPGGLSWWCGEWVRLPGTEVLLCLCQSFSAQKATESHFLGRKTRTRIVALLRLHSGPGPPGSTTSWFLRIAWPGGGVSGGWQVVQFRPNVHFPCVRCCAVGW